MNEVIHASGLRKQYGQHVAVDSINLSVAPGRIVGLIGPNGAGKTTVLKAILGLTSFEGDLRVLGFDPMRQRHQLMSEVCFIADVAVLPRWIRVNQVVAFVAGTHPRFSPKRCEEFLARTKIPPTARVRELSKGMIAQLHLALVMAIDARLLVLDEPTLGLDILYRKAFYETLLNDYFDENKTIVVTTHQVEEIEHILSDLLFIKDGRIVLDASMEEVQERFTEVMVMPANAEAARELSPLHERMVFGRHVFLYDKIDRTRLRELGELHNPSVVDLFVATMQEKAA